MLPTSDASAIGNRGFSMVKRYPGPTVLVVDDQKDVRLLLELVLERAGFRTVVAADAREARAMFARHRDTLRVLVTDIVMPGLSGVALAAQLRLEEPDLAVLYVTGYQQYGALADECLAKPFRPAELIEKIKG